MYVYICVYICICICICICIYILYRYIYIYIYILGLVTQYMMDINVACTNGLVYKYFDRIKSADTYFRPTNTAVSANVR